MWPACGGELQGEGGRHGWASSTRNQSNACPSVADHLSHNELAAEQLPSLIRTIYRALSTTDVPEIEPATTHIPAVPTKRSVFPKFIVCLEDSKKLKMLKRHLQTSYRMTPNDYRTKWGLPRDYPMVAPHYASTRSALAQQIGLGQRKLSFL